MFHNFSEAREFFSGCRKNKTMVEDFGREGGPRTVSPDKRRAAEDYRYNGRVEIWRS